MKTAKQTKPQGSASAHRILHVYRNRVMNVLVVLVLLLYFVLRVSYTVPREIRRCYELLSENIEQAERYQQYADDANELYLTVQDQDYLSACQLFIRYIESGEDIESCIDWLNAISDDFDSVFYLQSDGTLISPPDRPALELTAEEKEELFAAGKLQHEGDSIRYFCLDCLEDRMIIRIDESCVEQLSMDVLKLISLNGFVFNSRTLEIVEADEEAIPASFTQMYSGEPLESEYFTDPDLEIRLISPEDRGLARYTGMKLAAIRPMSYQEEGYSICAYIPVTEIASNILVTSGLPTLLCLALIFLSIYGSLHFRKVLLKGREAGDGNSRSGTIRLPFNCLIDTALARHILFMQFFMGLLAIFFSVVLLTISRFSTGYENARYNLEQLAASGAACQESLEECWDVYSSPAVGMAGSVNTMLAEGETGKEDVVRLVDSTFLEQVDVYDRNGENVFTTADSVGYPLSTDPASLQYQFWDLMSGDRQYILTRSDSATGRVYCAMKRTDAVGIVVLTFSDEGFGDLEQKLSPESIAARMSFCSSCLFMDKGGDSASAGAADSCYRIASDGTRTACENPNLPTLSNKESFCGFRTFASELYFVVGLGGESRCMYYLAPVSEITDKLGSSILTYIIFLLIVCFLDFLGCAVYTPESVEAEPQPEEPDGSGAVSRRIMQRMQKKVALSEAVADSQKAIWKHSLYRAIGLVAVTLLLDYLLNRNSLLVFLLKGQWEKGANLFAFTLITLAVLADYVLFRLLQFFFDELLHNFPAQYAAPCQMVHSIINIVVIVCLLVYAANQVGIDTATMLASVGISGLALGIAAKDTINDMLNGIFIILDGRIRVGDYVEISGFYGQVGKIGIRTTKVKRFNQEKSINNSDMKNLLNYSRGTASVYLQFRVSADTDIPRLKQLIADASPRFREACYGKLLGDMRFLGVDSFDADSITCSICAPLEECNRKSLTRNCSQVLLEVLNENGIRLASNMFIKAEDGRKLRILAGEPEEEAAADTEKSTAVKAEKADAKKER